MATKKWRSPDPRVLAARLTRQFPKEPHYALKKLRDIRGSDAPASYWESVEKEISACAMRKRHGVPLALCTCRLEGKRFCPEHGDPGADT